VILRRVLAGVLAAFWALVWFGLIDLLTAALRDPDFTQGYALETGWGLFHLALVAVPLAWLAVRPRVEVPVAMLAIAAVSVLLAALWGWSGRVALEGAGLAATTLLVGRPRLPRRRPDLVALALAVLALPAALWYAVAWINAMDPTPSLDDLTNGVSHYPMQGAFGFALVGVCGLVAVTRSTFAAACVTVCSVGFGVESWVDPSLDASLGRGGGLLLAVWGLLVVTAALRSGHADRVAAPLDHGDPVRDRRG
jgi:hypothetical protein